MGRKCKTYYVKSLNKELNIKELSKISGLESYVIYDRIHKLGWDVETAIKQPKQVLKYKVKNINSISNNITPNLENKIDDFISKDNKNLISPDYICYDLDNIPGVVKFVDCNGWYGQEGKVTPFKSHPNRYPKRWAFYVSLVGIAKMLNGYLYIINYDSMDDSEYRILKVSDYKENEISKYFTFDLKFCDYLVIEEDLKLNRDEFNEWVNRIDIINKQHKNNKYNKYRKLSNKLNNSIPSYYRDPKPSMDHLGTPYESFNKMCKAWNMNASTVQQRLNNGWSMEEALTIQARQRRA